MSTRCRFSLLDGAFAVVRLNPDEPIPAWALTADAFVSIIRTTDELSIVIAETSVPASSKAERGWRAIKIEGPFAFDQVGVLASFATPLAASGVSIFVVSTFDTDYILLKESELDGALSALRAAGHSLAEK